MDFKNLVKEIQEFKGVSRKSSIDNVISLLKESYNVSGDVVIDIGEGPMELVNPEIISSSDEVQISEEGCLSLPGQVGTTSRPLTVKVKAQDRNGKWHIYKGTEFKAKAFCHEIDHLDGVLYIDKLVK